MIFWHGRRGEHSHEISMRNHPRIVTDSSFCLLTGLVMSVMDWWRVIVSEYGKLSLKVEECVLATDLNTRTG